MRPPECLWRTQEKWPTQNTRYFTRQLLTSSMTLIPCSIRGNCNKFILCDCTCIHIHIPTCIYVHIYGYVKLIKLQISVCHFQECLELVKPLTYPPPLQTHTYLLIIAVSHSYKLWSSNHSHFKISCLSTLKDNF